MLCLKLTSSPSQRHLRSLYHAKTPVVEASEVSQVFSQVHLTSRLVSGTILKANVNYGKEQCSRHLTLNSKQRVIYLL